MSTSHQGGRGDIATLPQHPWEVKAVGGPGHPTDVDEVRRAAGLLFDPSCDYQIQGLPQPGACRTVHGGDIEVIVAVAIDFSGSFRSVYFTLNPVQTGLDRWVKSEEITGRRWLLIDIDPVKADRDQSASSDEKAAACAVAMEVYADLASLGWPDPLTIDSGNGFHLDYRIELPNDDLSRQWLKAILAVLAAKHNTAGATIDKAVHDAKRIARLPGTWAQKGEDTVERPHRPCRILSIPDEVRAVAVDQLKELAGHPAILKPDPRPAAPATPWQVRAGAGGREAYVKRAVELEVARVALAAEGERNASLNRAAFAVGTLLWTGYIVRTEAADRLAYAARRAGLAEGEIRTTARSGLDAGAAQPRTLPPSLESNGRAPVVAAEIAPGEPLTICAADVEPTVVRWLWPGRIPLGKLTTFAGWGGMGKSFVSLDIAARVSRGLPWPFGNGECAEPGNVLIVDTENGQSDTLVPRLIELGADLARIRFLQPLVLGSFTLADLDVLGRCLDEGPETLLVTIDPATAHLGGVKEHENAAMRALLAPLALFTELRQIAVVMITHVNKGGNTRSLDAAARVIGSVAWVNAVRSAEMFLRDPEDRSRRLMLSIKNNMAEDPKGLAYRIVKTETLATIEWIEEVETNADEAIDAARPPRQGGEVQRAADWLGEFLATVPKNSDECVRQGNTACNIDRRLYWWRDRILKDKLGGIPQKQGYQGQWYWSLPPVAIAGPENGAGAVF